MTLDHLVRSTDSASESGLDDDDDSYDDEQDETIQVKADKTDESLLVA